MLLLIEIPDKLEALHINIEEYNAKWLEYHILKPTFNLTASSIFQLYADFYSCCGRQQRRMLDGIPARFYHQHFLSFSRLQLRRLRGNSVIFLPGSTVTTSGASSSLGSWRDGAARCRIRNR